jgi:hypothetical protein
VVDSGKLSDVGENDSVPTVHLGFGRVAVIGEGQHFVKELAKAPEHVLPI